MMCTTRVYGIACGALEVVEAVTVSCVHEHFEPGYVCAHHLAMLDHGHVVCTECRQCSKSHRCVVRPVQRTRLHEG